MANIPLQSIMFPGLADKYTTPVVDNTLAVAGAAADAKKTGDEIGAIKNDLSDGTFIVNNAENAEQLTSTVGIEDTTPYLFRTSGGSNDIGDREDVRKIVGGTIAWNQLVENGNFASSSGWSVYDSTYSEISIADGICNHTIKQVPSSSERYLAMVKRNPDNNFAVANHKYLISCEINSCKAMTFAVAMNASETYEPTAISVPDVWVQTNRIVIAGRSLGYFGVYPHETNDIAVGDVYKYRNAQITDLTKDFGTSIADYVYSLETATAGAGVAWLKKHFPAQFDAGYQAYDAGSMQSVSGLTEHKMTGFNQWDEQYESGQFNPSTGEPQSAIGAIRSKNLIPVLPSTEYCVSIPSTGRVFFCDYEGKLLSTVSPNNPVAVVATPSGCHYIKFHTATAYGDTYNHDICINFHWDGEKDGTYEPYKTWSYALDDSITLRGIPKVDANGNLYYDGDEYLPDGTVNRRYGIVDLGTLTWNVNNHAELGTYFYANVTSLGIKYGRHQSIIDEVGICPKYTFSTRTVSTFADKTICYDGNNTAITQVCIKDSAYSDGATFKASLSGVYLVYVKQTPTTETASPYQATQIVDDFGTEEYVLADGAFPVPVGHDTMYQNNLRAKLEMSPDSPDGDGLYVVQQESGENTYVPLASTATIQDILTRLTALENA